jgi:hypothetical protein
VEFCNNNLFIFFIRSNIPEKEPKRLIEMLGRDSEIKSISVQGIYITDNLGNTPEKVISIITDKDEINELISVVSKYEFKYIQNTKLPEVKMIKDKTVLQGFTFRFFIDNPNNEEISANLHCYFPKNFIYLDAVKNLKGSGYKTVYRGTSIDENLFNYLETNYSK